MRKSYLTWVIAIVVIILGIWGVLELATNKPSGNLTAEITSQDQVKGNPEGAVVLVEYSDFQCPACRTYYPYVKQLAAEYPEDLVVVYRHFPLRQIHPYAELAAVVSEAAGRQGKFWEMHDLLFENQDAWAKSPNAQAVMVGYIQSLGLDLDKFMADLKDKGLLAKVRSDYRSGSKAKVAGTPTFFLNGNMIANPRSYDEFKQIIENAKSTATTTGTTTQATGGQATVTPSR